MFKSSLLMAVFAWFSILGLFQLVRPPLPASAVAIYMCIATAGLFVFLSADEERFRSSLRALLKFSQEKKTKAVRVLLLVCFPFSSTWLTYEMVKPRISAPFESRQIHVSPPSEIVVGGKHVKYEEAINPYRKLEKQDSEAFSRCVEEGKVIYFKHCFMCHGAKLDGRGVFAEAFDPLPLPFTGQDTIAQMEETYVYWRIHSGGPALPPSASPWSSAMPAWGKILKDHEIWKVVLYLYEATGNRPQVVR